MFIYWCICIQVHLQDVYYESHGNQFSEFCTGIFQIFNIYFFQILIFIFQWFILNIDIKFCWPKRILWPPLPPAKGFTNMHSNYFDFFMCSSTQNTTFANISGPPAIFSFSRLARQLIWTLSSVPMKLFFAKRENRGDLKCDNFSIYRDISSFYVCLGNITGLNIYIFIYASYHDGGWWDHCLPNQPRPTHAHTQKARQSSSYEQALGLNVGQRLHVEWGYVCFTLLFFSFNRSHAAVMMPLKSFDQAEQQRN